MIPLQAADVPHLVLRASEDLTLFTADRQLARNVEPLGVRTVLVGRT